MPKMYSTQIGGTVSRKFVKEMARKFDQIGQESSFEANFKQCNWWLDTSKADLCVDDHTLDSQDQCHPVDDQYRVNADVTTHTIAIDTAEIANEFQDPSDDTSSMDDPNKSILFEKITECLRFPSQTPNAENEKSR